MVYLGVRKRNVNEIIQVTALIKAKLEFKIANTTVLLYNVSCVGLVCSMGLCVVLTGGFPSPSYKFGFPIGGDLCAFELFNKPFLVLL